MSIPLEYSYPSTSTSSIPQNAFLKSVHDRFQEVLRYENSILLAKAKSHIPVEKLQIYAIERMRNLQQCIKTKSTDLPEMHLEEAFLVELVNWFKTSFFSWVNSPPCDFCSASTKYSRNIMKADGSDVLRVEVYQCPLCQVETEFPRHNDPAKLLITRKGRCGEWGNCFTLICRAMKYDARLVIDSTDHLWTEVYLPCVNKWVHCDPCENVIDAPLMYEAGWGKKLSYIIAYSKDEVQDVTWKYSSNHKEVLLRRNMCTENELVTTLIAMREKRWETLSPQRKKYVSKRICVELVNMMEERKPRENEKQGRSSGSLDWRLQRKETSWKPFVWIVGEYDETHIKYKTSSNTYEVFVPENKIIDKIDDWINGVYEMSNIHRKVENDWKMTYLARTENSDVAKLSWRIQVDDNKKIIEKIVIKVSSKTYENAKVEWTIHYKGNVINIPKNLETNFSLDVKNWTNFTLNAQLSGGIGHTAWQHSQILRQSINSLDYPLQISIKLKSISE